MTKKIALTLLLLVVDCQAATNPQTLQMHIFDDKSDVKHPQPAL